VLIQTALGRALEVVKEVSKVEGVEKACAVTGAYDIVATVNVKEHGRGGPCGEQDPLH